MTCPDARTFAARAAGDLTTNEARALEVHLGTCVTCASRAARMERLAGALPTALAEAPDAGFAARVSARLDATPRPSRRALFVAAPLAAAASLTAVSFLASENGTGASTPDDDSSLGLFAARGGGDSGRPDRWVGFDVWKHAPGERRPTGRLEDTLVAGEGLSFVATNRADEPFHVALFGVDAAGAVHWFHPAWVDAATNPTSPLLPPHARLSFEEAVAPEAAPGRLTILALFTQRPVSVREVERSLANGGAARLVRDFPDAALHARDTVFSPSR